MLQRYPKQPELQQAKSVQRKLFVLSGYDLQAVNRRASDLTVFLEQRPEVFEQSILPNLAYTLGQRRDHLNCRAAVTAVDASELTMQLLGSEFVPLRSTKPPRIAFAFTGQGAQWAGMGRELYDQYPIFRRTIDTADRCLIRFGASFSLKGESKSQRKGAS